MNAELGRQLGGTTTILVSHYQAIDLVGREAHLDLPWRYGLRALPGTSSALPQAQEAVA
jgi:hypothetical protein